MKTITFVVKAGNKREDIFLAHFKSLLNDVEYQIDWQVTEYAGHAIEIAAKAVIQKSYMIVAAGGDGTLNEIVNGMLSQNLGIEKLPILAVLPVGTANDFAKTIKAHDDIIQLVKKIKKDKTQNVDVGKISFTDLSNQAANRYFLNIADIGLGGEVVKRVNAGFKWLPAKLLFVKAITQCMLFYKKRRVVCQNDGEPVYQGKTMSIIAANGKFFGGGLCIAPKAKLDDGLLNLVVLGDITMLDYFRNLSKVRAGKLIKHNQVQYHTGKKIVVVDNKTDKSAPIPLEMDGEFVGHAPVIFECVPAALRVLKM